jgi:hypothetical protein
MNATILLLSLLTPHAAPPAPPAGDAVLRAKTPKGDIVITTTRRLAGAIHSLTFNGKEFIDSFDHGRQLQSASNFDVGQRFVPEVFNPTEAGSMFDGAGPRSSSKLLWLRREGNELHTLTQMAFWLRPGEKSAGFPARNTTNLSNHLLTKRVRVGSLKWPNVIDYQVTFHVPPSEGHRYAQFEALTGYMPWEFAQFWKYQPKTKTLEPLDDGPGEQNLPIIFATKDGKHAMGIFSPDQPSKGYEAAGYGRFRFPTERVVKWNCVFRLRNEKGIPNGDYSYRMFVIVGDLASCRQTMAELMEVKGK